MPQQSENESFRWWYLQYDSKTKYLEINLTKCEQDLYTENHVTLL